MNTDADDWLQEGAQVLIDRAVRVPGRGAVTSKWPAIVRGVVQRIAVSVEFHDEVGNTIERVLPRAMVHRKAG